MRLHTKQLLGRWGAQEGMHHAAHTGPFFGSLSHINLPRVWPSLLVPT